MSLGKAVELGLQVLYPSEDAGKAELIQAEWTFLHCHSWALPILSLTS